MASFVASFSKAASFWASYGEFFFLKLDTIAVLPGAGSPVVTELAGFGELNAAPKVAGVFGTTNPYSKAKV